MRAARAEVLKVTAISNRQGWGSSSNISWKAPRGTEKVTSHQDQRAGWFQTCNNNGFIPSLKWKLLHGAGCVRIKTKGLTCWTVGYKLTFTWGFISWISFTYKCSDPNHWTSQVLRGKSLFKISHHTTRRGNWEKKKENQKTQHPLFLYNGFCSLSDSPESTKSLTVLQCHWKTCLFVNFKRKSRVCFF